MRDHGCLHQYSPCFFIRCSSSLCRFSSELCRLISSCCCCCTSSWPWSWFPIRAPPPAPSAPPMRAPATGWRTALPTSPVDAASYRQVTGNHRRTDGEAETGLSLCVPSQWSAHQGLPCFLGHCLQEGRPSRRTWGCHTA